MEGVALYNHQPKLKDMKPIPKSQVIVLTRDYRREHDKAPRGFGAWWFNYKPTIDGLKDELCFPPMMYSEAKKKAIEIAARDGKRCIYVLS